MVLSSFKKIVFVGCLAFNSLVFAQEKIDVGVSMPEFSNMRWVNDGLSIMRELNKVGLASDLQYASGGPDMQVAQIESMIQKGAKVLVIAAIDGKKLTDVLKKAGDKKIKVISYDRLIRDSANIDYYATFDNYDVGVKQGADIAKRLDLAGSAVGSGKGPFRIELFAGSPDDNNATFFYNGAMSVLKPYIDKGQLVIDSGQQGMENVSTKGWNGAIAKARLVGLLAKHYTKVRLDAVLSPNDGIAAELITAFVKVGYGQPGKPMPVITGQDADIPSTRAVMRGQQSSTIFKDTRDLARVTAQMAEALIKGKAPAINDEKTYNNGVKIIPSFLLKPVLVDASNVKQVLLDSGFYRAEQIQ
jgi:putative multiple sugar transport system substrate-binding protein